MATSNITHAPSGRKILIGGPAELGWHKIRNLTTCPRKFKLEQGQSFEKPGVIIGSVIHHVLAHYYQGQIDSDVADVDEALDWLAWKNRDSLFSEEWEEQISLVRRTKFLDQYCAKHGYASRRWKVVGAELQLGINWKSLRGAKVRHNQRIDLAVQIGKQFKIIEHKKIFRATFGACKRYSLSGQAAGYDLLGRSKWGKAYAGCVFNMIAPPTDGDRWTFRRFDFDAPAAGADIRNTIEYARWHEEALQDRYGDDGWKWPGVYHEGAPCDDPWYGRCPFHEGCRIGKEALGPVPTI